MLLARRILLIAFLLPAMLLPTPHLRRAAAAEVQLEQFVDGEWMFIPDREWKGRAIFPDDPLNESDYVSVPDTISVMLRVSDHVRRIAFGAHAASDSAASVFLLTEADAGRLHFENHFWAGARFEVWAEGGSLQAEFTVYGSGLPIVDSVRGRLEPRP
jgi:hypothetical protein